MIVVQKETPKIKAPNLG